MSRASTIRLDPEICERARLSRDIRFDGRFFVGVVTTGIFCRPICPASPPRPANVRYYPSAAAAARAGLRPCLRCRPESAPGTPAWSGTSATVARALRQLESGALENGGVAELARRVGVGPRHLNRLFHKHLGASPIAVAQTRRLLFAKKLLDETGLKIADIALSSGFGSVRRFNDVFKSTYDRTPSELRRASRAGERPGGAALTLELPYRHPFDWRSLLAFLAPRALPGVEEVRSDTYRRNIAVRDAHGRLEIRRAFGRHALSMTVEFPETTALLEITERVRRLFDLDADPGEIRPRLAASGVLKELVRRRPGLRVPGAWDGFELAVRAILGQQITVKGATTLAGRLVVAYGRPVAGGYLFPTPAALCRARFSNLGLTRSRAATLRALARACADGGLRLEPGVDSVATCARLRRLPGIGEWTAQYIAMRALGEPDAFPATDLGLLKAGAVLSNEPSGLLVPARLRRLAEDWRPWRAYAAMHLWRHGSNSATSRR